jgi:hypothetical protein
LTNFLLEKNCRMRIALTIVLGLTSFAVTFLPAQNSELTITNETLTVRWSQNAARLSINAKAVGRDFLTDGKFAGTVNSARLIAVTDKTFGPGQAIEVSYSNGNHDTVMLFPKLPFVLVRPMLHNAGAETSVTSKLKALTATVDLGKPATQLKTLGTGGLLAADKNPGSYVWLAVAEPQTRNGVVFGWLTHERGSGVVFSKVDDGAVNVDAVIEYGKLRLAPGKTEDLETLAIGYFDDARLGLEQWADAVAKVHNVQLKPQPTGYCTWYSQPHGGASDEKHLAELAEYSAKNLAPFGFSVVQIDDKWQMGWKRSSPSSPKKDFRAHDPKGPYPKGMKAAADHIKSLGLVPGIWFMPFAGTVGDPFFDQHLDWFAKTPDGKPYDTPWGGTCLDMTNPDAREHLRDITRRICREWGFEYIKIDGLWTGTATKQLYVNSGYKEDDLGAAVFKDPDKTNIEVFRSGLKLVREAAGEKVFILGCNAPQNMRTYGGAFGLVDAMRVGPDNKAEWKSLLRGPIFGTRHYFLHGRLWWNDPDPVYVRDSIPLKHAQLICSWVALSGQLNLSSEWIPGLSAERLDVLKRTMPSHHAVARPVDLFEHDLPRVWTVNTPGRDVVGLFNWESSEQKFDVPLEQLGLNANTGYFAFDYWGNRLLPSVKGRLQLTLPAESSVVLAVRPRMNHPQLISTSRHVTQGIVDVTDEKWDAASKTLSGCSQVVGEDPYELRVVSNGAKVEKISLSATDIKASHESDESLTRVKFTSLTSRDITWSIQFK